MFSLGTLAGPLASNYHLPTVQPANAVSQPCETMGSSGACSEFWYPAGPEMSTELVSVFSNPVAEYVNLLSSNPSIDFPDARVPASVGTSPLTGLGYYLTQTVPELGYYEIQFMQANTFWNCNFSYGTSACGVQIRQGIAHMIDRSNFAADDPNIIAKAGQAIDNPIPSATIGSPLVPDSCNWDSLSVEYGNRLGTACTVNTAVAASGGVSYKNATAAGSGCSSVVSLACQAPGSADLDLAAQHFVNAGLATGFNPATSVLTGVPTSITNCGTTGSGCTVPTFFIRNDDLPRLDLGNAYEAQICYLFTGSFTTPCAPYLSVILGRINAFQGFQTSPTSVNKSWWFYTGGYLGTTFYDTSLYLSYDSAFTSASCSNPDTPSCATQVIGGGSCSNTSLQTASASDYMYICSPTYDSLASQLDTSPCLMSIGDPAIGSNSNTPGGDCPSTTILSSRSAAVQAMDYYGQNVFTLPVYELKDRFGYLQCDPTQAPCTSSNSWSRAVNDAGVGLPNYFTWLNAYNQRSGSGLASTIRQGFSENIRSENPFIASTPQDLYIVNNVYDTLNKKDPLSPSQLFNWMTTSTTPESAVSYNGGLTGVPTGTCTNAAGCTYRFILSTYLTWQDGRPVTAYDVAFSYLSLVGSGAFLGVGGASISGITILSPLQFDISVKSNGPFELSSLTGLPIIPGYWASNIGGSAWSNAVAACSGRTNCPDVQYTLNGAAVNCAGACSNFPAANMQVNPSWLSPSYTPIASHTFVGSGAWQCGTISGTTGSGTCDSPAGPGYQANSFALSAYTNYFRSTTRAATWIWSGESDQSGSALAAASAVGSCDNVPVNLSGPCGHYQQGIGNPGSGTVVSVSTVTTVDSFYLVNWVSPFEWTPKTSSAVDFAWAPLSPTPNTVMDFEESTTGGYGSFTWNFGDGSPLSSGSSAMHQYATTGTYGVILSFTGPNGPGSVIHWFTVLPGSPTTTLASDFTYTRADPTPGQIVGFIAAVSGGTSPYTYDWDFGDGSPHGNIQAPSHVYSNVGTYTVTLKMTDSATPANTFTITHSVAVVINGPPVGIGAFQPLLYALTPFDGSTTLVPNPGGSVCQTPNSYYDC